MKQTSSNTINKSIITIYSTTKNYNSKKKIILKTFLFQNNTFKITGRR